MESDITEVIQNIRSSFEDIEFDPSKCDAYLIAIQDRGRNLRHLEGKIGLPSLVPELVAKAIQQVNVYLQTPYPKVEMLWDVFKTRSELFYIDNSNDLLLEEPKFAEALGDLAFVHGDYEAAEAFYFDAVVAYVATKPKNHLESEERCRDKRQLSADLDSQALSDVSRCGERKPNYPVRLSPGMWEEEVPRVQKVIDYLERMTLNPRTPANTALESYNIALKTTSLVTKPPMSLGD